MALDVSIYERYVVKDWYEPQVITQIESGGGGKGAQGTTGAQGIQGRTGAQGIQGIAAQSIQGPQGPMGPQGPAAQSIQGVQGTRGIQGIQGIQGIIGVQGITGAKEVQIYSMSANETVNSSLDKYIIEATGTITITYPAGLPDYFQSLIVNVGTGTITIAPGAGVSISSIDGARKLKKRNAGATLYHKGGNAWQLFGALES